VETSVLGFGAMRLPLVGAQGGLAGFDPKIPIDEVEATKMVEYAIEQGVNYFDTAYGYHGGKSELFVGKALKPHRSKVYLASKLPVWNIEKPEDMGRIFNEQLQKLQTDYLDFYLVHGVSNSTWQSVKEKGVREFLDKLLAEGRIKFAGFSFHDEIKVFKEIVDSYDWSMCMLQYNFYDQDYQAGRQGIQYAASKGMGIVAMEPLRGGKLVDKIPDSVQQLWDSATVKRTPAEWGMSWIWNHAEIATTLSGSSSLAQLQENIKTANGAKAGAFSAEEISLVDKVREEYRKMLKVDCTSCAYCMPCPTGVDIPQNFNLYNDCFLFKGPEMNFFFYNQFLAPDQRASACTECMACIEKCPQKIDIPNELKTVDKYFTAKP
jgi:predicted aldo/keto reductase-like oxidoreductase